MKYGLVLLLSAMVYVSSYGQTTKDIPKNVEYKKFIERINGQWKLQQIVDEEQKGKPANKKQQGKDKKTSGNQGDTNRPDIANNAMQMIEFEDDARYKINSSTNAIDSGSYRLNEQHGILYLESDGDDVTPTEWSISIKNNVLTLAGRGQDADSRYKYIYIRSKQKGAK